MYTYIYTYTHIHKISPLGPALFRSWTLGEVKTFLTEVLSHLNERSSRCSTQDYTNHRQKRMQKGGLPAERTSAKLSCYSCVPSYLASTETAVLWSASPTMQPINFSSRIPIFNTVNINVWQYLGCSPFISHPSPEVLITAILRHSHLLVAFPEVYLLILQCLF